MVEGFPVAEDFRAMTQCRSAKDDHDGAAARMAATAAVFHGSGVALADQGDAGGMRGAGEAEDPHGTEGTRKVNGIAL
jgi:hypothetical protein